MQVTRSGTSLPKADTAYSKDELYYKLKGTTVRLPDLRPVFRGWRGIDTPHINPYYESLKLKVAEKLASLNLHPKKENSLKRADLALFAALWWPDVPPEQLETLANIAIWVFTWDDEVDEPSGSYAEDYHRAQAYRNNTTRFIGVSLGLEPADPNLVPMDAIVQSFDAIGTGLRRSYDEAQLRRFHDRVVRFVSATEVEQRHQLQLSESADAGDDDASGVPTLEAYMANRAGTSAVDITSASAEFGLSLHLPRDLVEGEAVAALWRETNLLFSITNDLVSFRKEFRTGSVENMVPLTFATTFDMGVAVAQLVGALQASRDRFDKAADALLAEAERRGCSKSDVESYIQLLRNNNVGNLVWR
ncbi:isoprenoid synthase domain-containing protein [Xylariaceae sp. FL0594]|nr:isoprenoid synthase domain-containing protein [Xylariaceae sp. FL0594]